MRGGTGHVPHPVLRCIQSSHFPMEVKAPIGRDRIVREAETWRSYTGDHRCTCVICPKRAHRILLVLGWLRRRVWAGRRRPRPRRPLSSRPPTGHTRDRLWRSKPRSASSLRVVFSGLRLRTVRRSRLGARPMAAPGSRTGAIGDSPCLDADIDGRPGYPGGRSPRASDKEVAPPHRRRPRETPGRDHRDHRLRTGSAGRGGSVAHRWYRRGCEHV